MIRTIAGLFCIGLFCAAYAADPQTVCQVLDNQFNIADREITSLVEAMPAGKFNFAPSNAEVKGGAFQGVRTFAQQAKHLATNIYSFSAAVLEEKPPVDIGNGEGPDSVQTKDQIVAYVKGAFAYGHKALLSVTEKNQMDRLAGGPHERHYSARQPPAIEWPGISVALTAPWPLRPKSTAGRRKA